jgi:hypothetical protein
MHVSCIQAGSLLARMGRPEASNCIAGLEQYSHSYEEAGDQAADMKRVYHAARYGEFDFQHMSAVVPRITNLDTSHTMMVDDHSLRSNGDSIVQVMCISYLQLSIQLTISCFSKPPFLVVIHSLTQSTEVREHLHALDPPSLGLPVLSCSVVRFVCYLSRGM